MKIVNVLTSPGLTGFYADDQEAIRQNAAHDGFVYAGTPRSPGFTSVRQKGEAVSVLLLLDDSQVAYGDCCTVQYPGVGGRDPVFKADEFIAFIEAHLTERLEGRRLVHFRPLAEEFDSTLWEGKLLHSAMRYGLTQALLDAVAKAQKRTMAEVVAEEYGLPLVPQAVPIFTQSGDERHLNVEKMILKRADVLPHGLFNNVKEKLGENGEGLLEFLRWIKKRARQLAGEGYNPTLHFDVYGTIGLAFKGDLERMADYLGTLQDAADPWELHIECPMIADSKEGQIQAMRAFREVLRRKGIPTLIVADEWCNTPQDIADFIDNDAVDMVQIKTPGLGGVNNTIESVLYTKSKGARAYLGGTCNETDRSSQVTVHIAIATQPDQILAKPGMGVDEGLMVIYNEMQRTLALLRNKLAAKGAA